MSATARESGVPSGGWAGDDPLEGEAMQVWMRGWTWGRLRRPVEALVLVLAGTSAAQAATTPTALGSEPSRAVSVIVSDAPLAGSGPERLVERLGGGVQRRLGLIDGFQARVPRARIASLRASPKVRSITLDRRLRLAGAIDGWDPTKDLGSMYSVAREVTGAGEYWNDGHRGAGVDVAMIDSGVVPVNGLSAPGKVVHGPDLSWESQAPNLRHLDTFGHGTHMAGIIAGRDDRAPRAVQKGDSSHFVGMAPSARIVSVKVADAFGATDVSQVIAAIDWVVQHRRSGGLNIRVLNLSFGTDGEQSYLVDPLAFAVEAAWRHGIVVVVSAGNGGFGSEKLNNPAYDPFVVAVGAADGNGTYDWGDDTVREWSSCGDGTRDPDLVAPGKSLVSLRSPGAYLDLAHPGARVGSRFFRGSGTSQAAAVVSGAAALILSQRPRATPDQVKALLKSSAQKLPSATARCQGAGMLNLKIARDANLPAAVQTWPKSTGLGSLELSRGSAHLEAGDASLRGERDVFGAIWNAPAWVLANLAGNSWSGGIWRGSFWSGNSWSGSSWSGNSWSGNSWSGSSWSGSSWSGNSWSTNVWSGTSWSGSSWSGADWSGTLWPANSWSTAHWGD